jgi:polyisoprenoid-binding protein YceI
MSAGVLAPERLTGVWMAVPGVSRAGFRVRDKVFGRAAGTIPVRSGTVRIGSAGAVETARVELDVTGIETGNAHRDRDLRKPHFLAADEHPTIVVEAVPAPPGSGGWSVAATVSARGETAPVDLVVTLDHADGASATVTVTGRLDRTALRMKVPTFIVGRWIDIDVRLVFRR